MAGICDGNPLFTLAAGPLEAPDETPLSRRETLSPARGNTPETARRHIRRGFRTPRQLLPPRPLRHPTSCPTRPAFEPAFFFAPTPLPVSSKTAPRFLPYDAPGSGHRLWRSGRLWGGISLEPDFSGICRSTGRSADRRRGVVAFHRRAVLVSAIGRERGPRQRQSLHAPRRLRRDRRRQRRFHRTAAQGPDLCPLLRRLRRRFEKAHPPAPRGLCLRENRRTLLLHRPRHEDLARPAWASPRKSGTRPSACSARR